MLRKTLDNLPLALPYLLVTGVAIAIFFPTWFRLAAIWLEFEQVIAHGLATAIILVGLLLLHPPKSSNSSRTINRPYTLLGGLFLISVTLVWGLLELVRIDTLTFLMLPAGVVAVSWALLGLHRTTSFIPYVMVLALSLPLWADIVPALVALASIVVGEWVRWFGMTALIEGNSITLPYGRLLIADGCSGIRYFAISILLAMMTSILNDYRWKGWVITVSIAILVALMANWIRITILVIVAYETNMESELLTDHETMGWIVFAAFVFPALYFSPVRKRSTNGNTSINKPRIQKKGLMASAFAFILGPVALTFANYTTNQKPEWTLLLPEFSQVQTEALPLSMTLPDTLEQMKWRAGNTWISLSQSQKTSSSEKLVPYLPPMFDKSVWHVEEQVAPGIALYRNILTRDLVMMAQWYQVGTQRSWTYRNAKLLQIPATLKGETRFALIAIQIPCKQSTCEDTLAKIQSAVSDVAQQLSPAS
ncbi:MULTISPECIES: exosortase/archaeosortase family protein [Marinobacter]|uniref:exosortase/archaeosortase family protein n=1 Tax=Marinobacter TaxID=2742 RepID=UPI001B10FB23|nr:exosortase/archaeosortase family protein [Marinobacter sp.]MBO6813040.1 exosortase/archaeosortase family protein [Marinobacter sp.]MBO6873084.1 exosortase/archaeosortase family protein [Marinobacter sp.]